MWRGVLLLLSLLAACSDDDGEVVRVFAASSLTDAFVEIESVFEAANPGVDVELNLAGSSALREQILGGAGADVYASANEATMAELVEAGEVDGEPVVFAANRLVVGVPEGNPGSVAGLADLADDGLLVGLCAEGVPCGELARSILDQAAVDAAVDTDEPNVRALAGKLAEGELDAGLVYATDAAVAGLEVIPIDEVDQASTPYPIATLVDASNDAELFVEFVGSEDGRAILAARGFEVP